VSRVAGEEAELTEATDETDARRQPQNGSGSRQSSTGACRVREREREGESERVWLRVH
jgi:hypothetical protein